MNHLLKFFLLFDQVSLIRFYIKDVLFSEVFLMIADRESFSPASAEVPCGEVVGPVERRCGRVRSLLQREEEEE